jgi:hypothetical protein
MSVDLELERINAIGEMGSAIFDSDISTAPGKIPRSTVSGALRNIAIYQLAEDKSTTANICLVIAYLTLIGRSNSTNLTEWESWVLTLNAVAFRGIADKITHESDGEYKVVEIPAEFLNTLTRVEDNVRENVPPPALPVLAGLPRLSFTYSDELYLATTLKACYGYVALVSFLMGKLISAANIENYKKSRSKNIIDKYNLPEAHTFFLSGGGRIPDQNLTWINRAWSASSAGRKAICKEYSLFKDAGSIAREIVYFMFRMLENAGMQPAYLIHQLLKALPEVAKIPILRPSYQIYAQSVRDYAKIVPHLRPYYKVMYGDSTKVFHSKSLQDITACAYLYLGQDNTTLRAYVAPGGAKAKAEFLKFCKSKGIDLEEFTPHVGSTTTI